MPFTSRSTPLSRFLAEHPAIAFFALRWVDFCGHSRARMLTKEYMLELEKTDGQVSSALTHMTVLPDSTFLPDYPPAAVQCYRPDWSSLRTFSYGDETFAALYCHVGEKHPNESFHVDRCPRAVLQRVLNDLQHLNIRLGFEIEFNLVDPVDWTMEPTSGYSSGSMFHTKSFEIVLDCVKKLQQNGIAVQAFHSEGGANQFEISTGPLSPLEAVDTLVQSQDIIRGVATRHGRHATMYPTPPRQNATNGLHANISFVPVDQEQHFIAGIIDRLPQLCAFSLASHDSYQRVGEGKAGTWVAWGTQNRDCPLRKIYPGRWEIRCFDSTANPYLAIAAYLAAGLAGLQRKEALTLTDCDQWVSDLDDDERQAHGIAAKLPTSMSAALQKLREDPRQLDEYLGEPIIALYVQVKEHELAKCRAMSEEERLTLFTSSY